MNPIVLIIFIVIAMVAGYFAEPQLREMLTGISKEVIVENVDEVSTESTDKKQPAIDITDNPFAIVETEDTNNKTAATETKATTKPAEDDEEESDDKVKDSEEEMADEDEEDSDSEEEMADTDEESGDEEDTEKVADAEDSEDSEEEFVGNVSFEDPERTNAVEAKWLPFSTNY